MKFESIHISKEIDFFTEIKGHYPMLTNHFYDKTLTALGVTHGEIEALRHSIVTEVNVPPIEGKGAKHPNLLMVYKGVYIDDIIKYLEDDSIEFKKIICTPEAFVAKVKPAFEQTEKFNMYKDFFMLFDECDKIISESHYREAIELPMDDFFEFDNKAMVSATPLIPSDPRFVENGFKFVKIKPNYDYSVPIDLIITNNVLESIKAFIKKIDEPLFIFFNSTEGIYSIIESLGIKKESAVFCGTESVNKLIKIHKFNNASSKLTFFSEFNFLTSRFFSAVDIDLPEDANVLIISDLFFAEHSIIDPQTDAVQIKGRFRFDKKLNKTLEVKRVGAKSVTHITNINPNIKFMTKSVAESYLEGAIDVVRGLKKIEKTTDNPGGKDALKLAIKGTGFGKFIKENNKLNYSLIDNFINYEKLKEIYSSKSNLVKAYQNEYFKPNVSFERYPIADSDKLKKSSTQSPDVLASLAGQIKNLTEDLSKFNLGSFDPHKELNQIMKINPFLYNAYEKIGYDGLENCQFIKTKITTAVIKAERVIAETNLISLESEIHDKFKISTQEKQIVYNESLAREGLQGLYTKYRIKTRASVSHFNYFFKAYRTTDSDNTHCIYLKKVKKLDLKNKELLISKLFKK